VFTPEGGLNDELILAMQIERELETEDLVMLGQLRRMQREATRLEAANAKAPATQPAPAVRLAPGR
jgi:hypothetical protein